MTYQNAVREELDGEPMLVGEMRRLTFYFFRRVDRYIDAADRVRSRNYADATNLQKGLEDALQGILFENDREVVDIRSVIVQQGHEVDPGFVVIHAAKSNAFLHGAEEIPSGLLESAYQTGTENVVKPSRWQNAGDDF